MKDKKNPLKIKKCAINTSINGALVYYLFVFLAIIGKINPRPIKTNGVNIFNVIWKNHSFENKGIFLGKTPIEHAKAVKAKHQTPINVANLSFLINL